MTPTELLTSARNLIARPDAAIIGAWPRTAALLTRQALEDAVNAYWVGALGDPLVEQASMRSKLIALPFYLDEVVARQIAFVNAALTSACHYHAYELAPTAAELIRWIDDVEALVNLLTTPGRNAGQGPGAGRLTH